MESFYSRPLGSFVKPQRGITVQMTLWCPYVKGKKGFKSIVN